MMKVLFEPKGLLYETDAQSTLLEAALRSGVVLPNSCRNGTCRTCICLMRSGSVAYRIEWPGLSFDEKREGYILPCVAVAQEDVVIESPAAKRKDV